MSGPGGRRAGSAGQAGLATGLLAIAIGVLMTPPLLALDADSEQPMLIEADAAEFDEKQAISLYLGNVEVQQGSMRIRADEVLVHHKPNRQPRKIIAIGNPVRYRQLLEDDPDAVRARAQRMEYEAEREEITLIDDAELIQGEDRFRSDRIIYNRITERLTAGTSARGRERVKIRIEPQPQPQTDAATAGEGGG
ncbi:lipopolysaccharide transport periplasmic protein LptA [uncultured Thiohalocapsa sp.]|uniref:lipopolysaccharide transport periplasmic protein LptA n=1 Tax=uncultured Thiohalocapsa sp. TaxID=768990 RepID=UPI0025E7C220|nr:lipopolysaccharide transport periplasmic protein LptA [uncultured Thiohalocapsa sp.]